MARVKIWIIGDPGGAVGGVTAALGTIGFYDYIRVQDLKDMVTKIVGRLKPGDQIELLHITDHAFSYSPQDFGGKRKDLVGHGGQAIGKTDVQSWDADKYVTDVAPLRARMAADAKIILEGCTVGRADYLLLAFSRLFGGVQVSGGTSYQRPIIPGIEGALRTCQAGPAKAIPQGKSTMNYAGGNTDGACYTEKAASVVGRAGNAFDEKVVMPSRDFVVEVIDKIRR